MWAVSGRLSICITIYLLYSVFSILLLINISCSFRYIHVISAVRKCANASTRAIANRPHRHNILETLIRANGLNEQAESSEIPWHIATFTQKEAHPEKDPTSTTCNRQQASSIARNSRRCCSGEIFQLQNRLRGIFTNQLNSSNNIYKYNNLSSRVGDNSIANIIERVGSVMKWEGVKCR